MIYLSLTDRQAIAHHAERTYPDECCGLLFGWRHADGSTKVTEIWALDNAWDESAAHELAALGAVPLGSVNQKRQHYWIDPKDLLEAQRYVRQQHEKSDNTAQQFDMIGIYHSHPEHPAIPSECDRICAWAEYSYIIVSVQQGRACDLLSWKLDDTHQFQPEELSLMTS